MKRDRAGDGGGAADSSLIDERAQRPRAADVGPEARPVVAECQRVRAAGPARSAAAEDQEGPDRRRAPPCRGRPASRRSRTGTRRTPRGRAGYALGEGGQRGRDRGPGQGEPRPASRRPPGRAEHVDGHRGDRGAEEREPH